MSNNKAKLNIRVNSSILYLFSQVGANKYRIKTISKFFADRLNHYLEEVKSSNLCFNDFIIPTFNSYNLNKNYTITLDSVYISKLKELSLMLSISEPECFRRILNLVCFENIFLLPQPNTNYSKRVKNETYTKFRFSVSKELLYKYKEIYREDTLEDNLTAALNDTIKEALYKIKKRDSSFIQTVLKENTVNSNNDYKYNFTISNRRFEEFSIVCESIGVSPQECLRKSMSFYIKDKTKEVDKINI